MQKFYRCRRPGETVESRFPVSNVNEEVRALATLGFEILAIEDVFDTARRAVLGVFGGEVRQFVISHDLALLSGDPRSSVDKGAERVRVEKLIRDILASTGQIFESAYTARAFVAMMADEIGEMVERVNAEYEAT